MLGNAKHFVLLPLDKANAKLHILPDNKHYGYNKIVKNDKIKRKHQQSGYS